MRPTRLDEFVGQSHLLAADRPLRRSLEAGQVHSMIFWGPPGVGKTTLARLLADRIDAQFLALSAVTSGVKEVRSAVETARAERDAYGRRTILFLDEVHRFNKSQQDTFLPYVEDGTLTLVGATTENPSFELNSALLSRCRVYVLKSLDRDELLQLMRRALTHTGGLGGTLNISEAQLGALADAADGDGRRALGFLEMLADISEPDVPVADQLLLQVTGDGVRRFDKRGEQFYDQISALHKALRGSSPDAGLYWFARMVDGGCDPRYIARRLIRFAAEDVGLADPRALSLALAGAETYERLGSPEGELALAEVVLYLAVAPKSNSVYAAWNAVNREIRDAARTLEVPLRLRNAPTRLMKSLEYGKGYRYAHDEPDQYAAGESYLPDGYRPQPFYTPGSAGLEARIAERLRALRERDDKVNSEDRGGA